ncbi:hypothetical protein EON67_10980 [archaeon]|nr:MAG: hypothetical protein EON67_10980 [archaeon]
MQICRGGRTHVPPLVVPLSASIRAHLQPALLVSCARTCCAAALATLPTTRTMASSERALPYAARHSADALEELSNKLAANLRDALKRLTLAPVLSPAWSAQISTLTRLAGVSDMVCTLGWHAWYSDWAARTHARARVRMVVDAAAEYAGKEGGHGKTRWLTVGG